MRVATKIELSAQECAMLERVARSEKTSVRLARRAKIVLLAAQGKENIEIASALGVGARAGRPLSGALCEARICGHRTRFAAWRTQARDRDRGDCTGDDADAPTAATHWSSRKLAKELGVSDTTILRAWRQHGLKPHRVRTFKVSRDPRFVEKLEDIVGLYLNPPEHALVLCCDEKSQVQALDRTQPGLPLKKGRAGTMTHDYKRHGTTTLFAALNTLDGSVIACCQQRHRHEEWLTFLGRIDRQTPKDKQLHLICDNYSTHKHPKVQAWLSEHPRFNMHFTPTQLRG